mmetsp:Transcript_7148/g.21083  ORF Transcript_7148/g.21083 Transcript_7148/m.21083 type:complete len:218 (+) Transcript_7148:2624-3277(+)
MDDADEIGPIPFLQERRHDLLGRLEVGEHHAGERPGFLRCHLGVVRARDDVRELCSRGQRLQLQGGTVVVRASHGARGCIVDGQQRLRRLMADGPRVEELGRLQADRAVVVGRQLRHQLHRLAVECVDGDGGGDNLVEPEAVDGLRVEERLGQLHAVGESAEGCEGNERVQRARVVVARRDSNRRRGCGGCCHHLSAVLRLWLRLWLRLLLLFLLRL